MTPNILRIFELCQKGPKLRVRGIGDKALVGIGRLPGPDPAVDDQALLSAARSLFGSVGAEGFVICVEGKDSVFVRVRFGQITEENTPFDVLYKEEQLVLIS
ncbi:MAG: hypothetical protein Q8Q90_03800 [bacterium]|nr:hypothetical protein [bacterium]